MVKKGSYIYESPDQGKTVFKRRAGESDRQLVEDRGRMMLDIRDQMREDQLWYNIRKAAHDNPALQEVLEQAIIIYTLGKKE